MDYKINLNLQKKLLKLTHIVLYYLNYIYIYIYIAEEPLCFIQFLFELTL